ncbi:MAG: hypothetical protein JNL58_07950 [Planctomyces sp.]|nr:hypothetical protein [Planctomyces sp.]
MTITDFRFVFIEQVGKAMRKIGLVQFALLMVVACSGCSTGPTFFERKDPYSHHEPGSDAWWAEKAALPPGVRQTTYKGKQWPARPRSNMEKQQFSHTYYSEHYWPLPYVCQDRAYVHAAMEQQTALGWQEDTTLFNRHFEPETQQLTRAGQRHLDYILHVVPPERRAVYIQSTYDPAVDSMRTEAVNAAMAEYNASGNPVDVAVRDCQELSRPAKEISRINQLYYSSIPAPRLKGSGGGSSTGAAAGGGAAAAPSSN